MISSEKATRETSESLDCVTIGKCLIGGIHHAE